MKKQKEEQKIEEVDDEESGLEEDIEEVEEEIEEDKFVEFMAPSTASLTALGQVAVASELRATDLERDLSEAPVSNGNKDDKEDFKYSIGSNSEEEAKYITSGNEIERAITPSSTDIINLGKESNLITGEVGFSASPSTKITEPGPEKYELPDKFDIDKAGKGELFERTDVKYKPSV